MRKKIPTITRPDPSYAASLRPEAEAGPGREEAQWATTMPDPADVRPVGLGDHAAAPESTPLSPKPQPGQEAIGRAAPPTMALSAWARRSPATRKIDIRVNALERQEEALIDCGVDPAHVIRAALRRAVKGWKLGPEFVPPSEEQRTRITDWRARTSLAVDAGAVSALLRTHDPLDVLSKWTLIRGQLEPRVWTEIDLILSELDERSSGLTDAADASSGGSAALQAGADRYHTEPDRTRGDGHA